MKTQRRKAEYKMKKIAIVINGRGGVGKDTLCDLASRHFRVKNISSVTPIKEIATMCGWDGRKDPKSRKFLSDLKQLCVEFNDFPTNWAYNEYLEFLENDQEVFFVHIREGAEIQKFIDRTGGRAVALLVRGGERMTGGALGNASDDEVENFSYNYYYTNDKPLEDAEREFVALLRQMLEDAK